LCISVNASAASLSVTGSAFMSSLYADNHRAQAGVAAIVRRRSGGGIAKLVKGPEADIVLGGQSAPSPEGLVFAKGLVHRVYNRPRNPPSLCGRLAYVFSGYVVVLHGLVQSLPGRHLSIFDQLNQHALGWVYNRVYFRCSLFGPRRPWLAGLDRRNWCNARPPSATCDRSPRRSP
jgi:hypothetical protein